MSVLGDLANRVRNLPLEEILHLYGFVLQKEGRFWRAKNEHHNIVFHGERWFDNHSGIGGGGAIDLVRHLTGESFLAAVKSLAHKFAPGGTSVVRPFAGSRHITISQKSESFESLLARLGKRDDSQWEVARRYLIGKRCIDPQLIDELHIVGKIYANDHRPNPSVVFLHIDPEGNGKGATLRDTKHHSSFRPSLGDKKKAWFTIGNLSQAQSLIITEAPIDALSYWCLTRFPKDSTAIVSVSGTHVSERLLEFARTHKQRVIIAFDNDQAGELAAARLKGFGGKFYRHRPNLKDWNEDLRFLKQSEGLLTPRKNIPRIAL